MARRGRARRRPRLARALILGAAILVTAALGAVGWLLVVYPKGAGPGRGREVRVEIARGMDVGEVAERLGRAGALRRPRVWAAYARFLGAQGQWRSGAVLLRDDMTPRDVLQRVATGFGNPSVRVTIPEGFHRFDAGARLERWGICSQEDFLRASTDRELLDELGLEAASAEGYLFPDTYVLEQDTSARDVVRTMVTNWQRRAGALFDEHPERLASLADELSWTRHEVVLMASIVEKEAARSEERPIIARVFMNRLAFPAFRPKRLQADPAVSYGCIAEPERAPSCAGFDGRSITGAMLADRANRYNTYRHEGLPPGPICNPGVAALRAVLLADRHDYLYFVARGGRSHAFSATLEEHNAAVARYRALQASQ